MYFSEEHLSPIIDVDSYVLRLFENDEHKKRIQSILRAVIGIIASASLIIHRVGRGLQQPIYDKIQITLKLLALH